MEIQQRLLNFITMTNWFLFISVSIAGFIFASKDFAMGILAGGLIVTVNFHFLRKTLNKALTPPNLASHHVVIAKYYVRFFISGLFIFFLISQKYVDPLGLFIGLSIVVTSIILGTLFECKKLIFKEAI